MHIYQKEHCSVVLVGRDRRGERSARRIAAEKRIELSFHNRERALQLLLRVVLSRFVSRSNVTLFVLTKTKSLKNSEPIEECTIFYFNPTPLKNCISNFFFIFTINFRRKIGLNYFFSFSIHFCPPRGLDCDVCPTNEPFLIILSQSSTISHGQENTFRVHIEIIINK